MVFLYAALRQSLAGRQDRLVLRQNVAFTGHEIGQHTVSTIVED